ncbi:MAG: hypothetical protein KBD37_01905 [Burkholderiales bacterium]|nr:hypothetical protein [Burkholderiales bacterium]
MDNFNQFYQNYLNVIETSNEEDANKFSVSKAIIDIMDSDIEIYEFANSDYGVALNIVITAWNAAVINDQPSIQVVVMHMAEKLQPIVNKPQEQIEARLHSLVKLKQKLYPDCYRYITEYSSEKSADGDSADLNVVSTSDVPADYFANIYREILFNPNVSKH